jgi:Zn-dependent protease
LLGLAVLQTVMLTLFVYLHELGHTLAALQSRTIVSEITLYPYGGAAMLGSSIRSPQHEMAVAACGPLVNLVLMGVFWAAHEVLGLGQALSRWTQSEIPGIVLLSALWLNAALSLFNLLPVFPLDGGRILRAFLACRLGPARATYATATLGQVLAIPLGLLGLYLMGLWGGVLVFAALASFSACRQEKLLAREGSVYAEGWEEWRRAEWAGDWQAAQARRAAPPGPFSRWRDRRRRSGEMRRQQEEREFQARVDEALAKVKREGMGALTWAERRLLRKASRLVRQRRNKS